LKLKFKNFSTNFAQLNIFKYLKFERSYVVGVTPMTKIFRNFQKVGRILLVILFAYKYL